MAKTATRDPSFEARQFRLELVQALLAGKLPNPPRDGCPASQVLRAFAEHSGPLRETVDLIDHVMQCSPCYKELTRYRAELAAGRSWVPIGVAAAVLVGLGTWFLSARLATPPPPVAVVHSPKPPPAPPPAPPVFEPQPIAAVLNLEGLAPMRGAESSPVQPMLRLQRRRMNLYIRLPIGSEPGLYEVRIGRQRIEQRAKGSAFLRDGATTIRVPLDLRSLESGVYDLATRREGEAWHFYRVRLR